MGSSRPIYIDENFTEEVDESGRVWLVEDDPPVYISDEEEEEEYDDDGTELYASDEPMEEDYIVDEAPQTDPLNIWFRALDDIFTPEAERDRQETMRRLWQPRTAVDESYRAAWSDWLPPQSTTPSDDAYDPLVPTTPDSFPTPPTPTTPELAFSPIFPYASQVF